MKRPVQERNRVASRGEVGSAFDLLQRLKGFIDRGVADQQEAFACVWQYTEEVRQIMDLLTDEDGPPLAERKSQFTAKIEAFRCRGEDMVYAHFAKIMTSFQPGPVRRRRHDQASSRQLGPGALVPFPEVPSAARSRSAPRRRSYRARWCNLGPNA